jgi:phospholipid/cholesterol/gamma-HCH transport system ATP-binding protein
MGVLVDLIRQLNDASRLTSIVVSHDVGETASIADRIYLIADGKVMAQGTAQEIDACGSDWVQQFMRGEPDGPVHFHYPAPELERDFLG